MNFPFVLALTALLHAYIGWRLAPELVAYPGGLAGVILMLLVSVVFMPLGMMARRVAKPPLADALTWVGLVFMGLFSSLFVLTLLRDVGLLLLGVAGWMAPEALSGLRGFDLQHASAIGVPALALLVTLLGFWNARRTAAVTYVTVPVAGLPLALQGFTVAQITDVHVGPTIRKDYLRRIVNKVNRFKPDMVAITGDLVDGQVPELAEHVAPLAELVSRHGTYFVTGNHEYYSGAHAWIDELRRLGLCVLMNEHRVLRHQNHGCSASLVVAGVADWSAHHFDPAHRSDAQAAMLGGPADAALRILLAHQPRSAAAAAAAGFDLQLSGHTHGGQFWPWNLFVRFQQPFTAGLHKLEDMWVYTSRGTGYWGPPKRFGAPSEITCLRLVLA